jgi:signal transduction histidine kinase
MTAAVPVEADDFRVPDMARPASVAVFVIALVGLSACGGAVVLAMVSNHLAQPGVQVALIDWITVPLLGAGLVAWWRHPDSRSGPLMLIAGFATTVSTLQWANVRLPYTIGGLFDLLVPALFLHVFLAYPSGRVPGRLGRTVVISAYGVAAGVQLVKLFLGSDPRSLLTVAAHPRLADVIERVQLMSLSVLCLAGVVTLAVHRRRTRHRLRRPAALLVNVFGLALVMLAVLLVAAAFRWSATPTIRYATFAVLGATPVVFLLGLIDARLAQANVGALLLELQAYPTRGLRDPLRRALRDPSLTLAYWLPDFETWADQDGRPVPPPYMSAARGVTVIRRTGEPVAALSYDASVSEEHELLDAVTAAAAFALDNDRLTVELRARVQELRESRARILEVALTERQRLERDLHDGAQQRLVALSLELGRLAAQVVADADIHQRLGYARDEVGRSLAELREVAHGIYPAVLSAHGLHVALDSLASRTPVPLTLDVARDLQLPTAVKAAAYYVVAESLTNIAKHAHATSARVDVHRVDASLVVETSDNGVGGADPEGGSGLRGLADRIEVLGGRLRVWTPLGGGTRVRADIPCA